MPSISVQYPSSMLYISTFRYINRNLFLSLPVWLKDKKMISITGMAWGTGMIASSSTFCPHLGRAISDLFRLLDAVYGIVREH